MCLSECPVSCLQKATTCSSPIVQCPVYRRQLLVPLRMSSVLLTEGSYLFLPDCPVLCLQKAATCASPNVQCPVYRRQLLVPLQMSSVLFTEGSYLCLSKCSVSCLQKAATCAYSQPYEDSSPSLIPVT